MGGNLEDLAQRLISAATDAGAEAADALAVDATSISVEVLKGELEHAERSESTDIGLRVLVGQRQACVSASDTSAATIKTLAERAVAMAREAPEDEFIGLATPDQLTGASDADGLELADASPEPSPAELENDARIAEQVALGVQGISQVQTSAAGYSRHAIHLAASNGFSGGYSRTSRATSCVAITGEGTGKERDYSSESRVFQADLPGPDEIGRIAAERTVARAGARKPPTGAYPVLYDERISGSLIGHLMAAINGAAVVRGATWARDLLGKQVLPADLSVIEDPSRRRVSGSRPFDGEGLPAQTKAFVQDGVLTGWVLDLATARHLGMASTGNAARGTSAPPSPSVGNIQLTQGTATQADLLDEMGTGLLVTSMIGSSVNPTTGDYSRGASGFWVENGEITYPVNECTIAGNLRDMLGTLVPANDARTYMSRVIPSVLVSGMTIAGE